MPPLDQTLSLLRLHSDETTLLRACLLDDERGSAALQAWSHAGAELLPPRWNRLFPLLAEAARRFDVTLPPVVRSRLRAALASEEVRYEAYCRVLRLALTTLQEEGLTPIVLKGAAIAESIYPRPMLRHSHDVDLMFAREQQVAAVAALERRGWRRTRTMAAAGTETLMHSSGLPLGVHSGLIRGSLAEGAFAAVRTRAQSFSLTGMTALTLSDEDTLVNILGQAVTSGTFASLQWACDAFFCIARAGSFDWSAFVAEVARARITLTGVALLRGLRDALDLCVPQEVLDDLARRALPTRWAERETVVASLDSGGFGRRRMWAQSSWPTRLILLKWLVAPRADLAGSYMPRVPRWQIPLRNLKRAALRPRAPQQVQ